MRTSFFKGVVLGAVVASAMMVATAAVAGTGIGAVLNLGQANKVNGTTSLTDVGNSPALALNVLGGQAPFRTNSAVRVDNLNADKLDGLTATQFTQGFGKIREGHLHLDDGTTAPTSLLLLPGVMDLTARCIGGTTILDALNVTSPAQQIVVYFTGAGLTANQPIDQNSSLSVLSGGTGTKFVTIQVFRPGHVATITTTAAAGAGCEYNSQAIQQ